VYSSAFHGTGPLWRPGPAEAGGAAGWFARWGDRRYWRPFGSSSPLRMDKLKILSRCCRRGDDGGSRCEGRGLKIVVTRAG
jgi:hypothetical protein